MTWVKTKYNRPQLKLEFFSSDYSEAKPFIESLWMPRSWPVWVRCKWWAKDKQKYLDKIVQKALTKKANDEAKKLWVTIEFLMKAKKNALIKIAKLITEDEDIWMKDLVNWLSAMKTELGEPSKITKNENTNFNTEQLSEEDEEILNKIFDKWNE